jgi:type I restriction enzyme S subunit
MIDYIDISSVDNINKRITGTQTIPISNAPSRARQLLKYNDVLVSNVRPNLNAVAINNIKSKNQIVGSTGYCVLRCNENLHYKYLFYFCRTKRFVERLSSLAKGSSYPAVTNEDVYSSKIPIPSFTTQGKIVEALEKKISGIDCLNKALEEQTEAINAIPAAILRKAFAGEM